MNQMTYNTAMKVAQDFAMKRARKAGRQSWTPNDFRVAAKEFNRLTRLFGSEVAPSVFVLGA